MSGFVVDASVAVKWVLAERESEQAAWLFGHRLLGPDLLGAECANILWKAVRRGELDAATAEEGLRVIEDANVTILPTTSLLLPALRRAVRLGHPVYDCLYLEVAASVGLPLVTADRRLARLADEGAEVVLLSDLPA